MRVIVCLLAFAVGSVAGAPHSLAAKNARGAARKKAKGAQRPATPPVRPSSSEQAASTPAAPPVKLDDASDLERRRAQPAPTETTVSPDAPKRSDAARGDAPVAEGEAPPMAGDATQHATAPPAATPSRIGLSFSVHGGVLGMMPARELGVTWSVGGELRERFPFLRRTLALAVAFDFFEPSLSGAGTSQRAGGDIDYRVSLRMFQLSADLLVFLPLELPVDFYAGGGYSAFFASANERAFDLEQSELQLRHGFRARVGLEWPFHRLLFLAVEAVYHYTTVTFRITGPLNVGGLQGRLVFGVEL